MTERDETTRPLTAEMRDLARELAARPADLLEFRCMDAMRRAEDALDAREAQTCSRCKRLDIDTCMILGRGVWVAPDFYCKEWAAKEPR